MFYRLNEEHKMIDYSDTQYFSECQYTDLISALEYQEHPNKVIVVEIPHEEEVPIYDEDGNIIGYETITTYTYELESNPDYEQEEAEKERERINQLSLTRREVFLALLDDKGITPEQLRYQIQDERSKVEFDYAEKYYRGNPLINGIGALLGYSPSDLDYLFINKEFPKGE